MNVFAQCTLLKTVSPSQNEHYAETAGRVVGAIAEQFQSVNSHNENLNAFLKIEHMEHISLW